MTRSPRGSTPWITSKPATYLALACLLIFASNLMGFQQ